MIPNRLYNVLSKFTTILPIITQWEQLYSQTVSFYYLEKWGKKIFIVSELIQNDLQQRGSTPTFKSIN